MFCPALARSLTSLCPASAGVNQVREMGKLVAKVSPSNPVASTVGVERGSTMVFLEEAYGLYPSTQEWEGSSKGE
jgi:hypothetical protein